MDTCADESCDLVKIAGVKFMAAQGDRERPTATQYLSVHCNISLLVLSSGLEEVTKVPVRGFLHTATTSWDFMWERWLPDFQWEFSKCQMLAPTCATIWWKKKRG